MITKQYSRKEIERLKQELQDPHTRWSLSSVYTPLEIQEIESYNYESFLSKSKRKLINFIHSNPQLKVVLLFALIILITIFVVNMTTYTVIGDGERQITTIERELNINQEKR
jgi:hypothetical protein